MNFTHFNVPKFRCAVHGSCANENSVRVERDSDYFTSVSIESSQLFSRDSAPDFGRMVEGASTDFISKRNIKSHTVNGVFVSFKWVDEVSSCCVPYFTGTIIAAGKKLISIFVETAIGEGKDVSLRLFDEGKLL